MPPKACLQHGRPFEGFYINSTMLYINSKHSNKFLFCDKFIILEKK